MYLYLQRIIRNSIDPPKNIKNLKKIKNIQKDLSPRTIRKNLSNENFMKFQWSWTL